MDTKVNLLQCQGAELHLEMATDPVVGIIIDVVVHHQTILKLDPINLAWSKYLDTKINLQQCQGAELHFEVALDHVVGNVVGVG